MQNGQEGLDPVEIVGQKGSGRVGDRRSGRGRGKGVGEEAKESQIR